MRQRVRGVIHVHTTLSHDGRLEPSNVAALCRKRGLQFAAIADHAEDLDADSLARLVEACERCSDDRFTLIPGLEHRFEHGVHILALGQDQMVAEAAKLDAYGALASRGCVLIAAHCSPKRQLPASLLEMLTAVEIWNVGRHTRLLPMSEQLSVYRKWAVHHSGLHAIGGLDMHSGGEWGCEVVLSGSGGVDRESILQQLRAGGFHTKGLLVSFGARPTGGVGDFAFAAGDVLARVRNARNRMLHRA